MDLAPIVLFVYKRLNHTKLTIDSLLQCEESKNSIIYIYSDAPKSIEFEDEVIQVRNYLKKITGFKQVFIIQRETNYGLAKNIISGLNEIFEKNEKAIILEDDIIVSKHFLKFMNDSLSLYLKEKKIWHISGWNYPIINNEYEYNSFFLQVSNCWGWGTWSNRWKYFKKTPSELLNNWGKEKIYKFTFDRTNPNFWQQIKYNQLGKINTWAIFWYATIFEHNGLCLNPTKTHTVNIGNDGSGENCDDNDIYKSIFCNDFQSNFPEEILLEENYFLLIKDFYFKTKLSLYIRIKKRVMSLLKFSK